MRSAIFTLLATLWICAEPALSRNGETGILIVIKSFKVELDADSHRTILICADEWKLVSDTIESGQPAQILLGDQDLYTVEENDQGELRAHLSADSSDESYSLISRECPINSDDHAC